MGRWFESNRAYFFLFLLDENLVVRQTRHVLRRRIRPPFWRRCKNKRLNGTLKRDSPVCDEWENRIYEASKRRRRRCIFSYSEESDLKLNEVDVILSFIKRVSGTMPRIIQQGVFFYLAWMQKHIRTYSIKNHIWKNILLSKYLLLFLFGFLCHFIKFPTEISGAQGKPVMPE